MELISGFSLRLRRMQGHVSHYLALAKARLSASVALSAALGYGFAAQSLDMHVLLSLLVGGWLVSCSGSALNQWIEQEKDQKMYRTRNRPLIKAELSNTQALRAALLWGCIGWVILYVGCSLWVMMLSLLAWGLYVWVYTPWKQNGPIAVLIGAIPGAMPPLLGCMAAEGALTYKAGLLFGIQFIWQFPHFWAIGWVVHEDYTRAGFCLLPGKGRNTQSALQIFFYSMFLVLASLLPSYFGICGFVSAGVVLIAGLWLCISAGRLLMRRSINAARHVMIASIAYLPIIQLAYVLDRLA